jgi:uncharacterized protein YdbL (DUF1318 family)
MAASKTRQKITAVFAVAGLATISGCKTPSINLATNEPIKVDIAMRLDVYQHNNGDVSAAKPSPTPVARGGDPVERRKNRQADIQVFKNSRLVGEDRTGMLVVLVETQGDYGDYVRRSVASENADRMAQMKAQADKEKRSLVDIQKEQAALWANRSFKGEWIESRGADGNFRWVQKQG